MIVMDEAKVIKASEEFFRANIPKSRVAESYIRQTIWSRNYALKLAEIYSADKFVLEVSAYLHDIGADVGESHPSKSAKMAKEFLLKLEVPKAKLAQITSCISNHKTGAKTYAVEEDILQDSDALVFLEDTYKVFLEKQKKKSSEEQARKNTVKKIKTILDSIHTDGAKKLALELFNKIPSTLRVE
jgi:hypothetical protein